MVHEQSAGTETWIIKKLKKKLAVQFLFATFANKRTNPN